MVETLITLLPDERLYAAVTHVLPSSSYHVFTSNSANCALTAWANLTPYRRAGRRLDGSTYVADELRGDPCYGITKGEEHQQQGVQAIARIIAGIRTGGFFWDPSATYGPCPVKHAWGTRCVVVARWQNICGPCSSSL